MSNDPSRTQSPPTGHDGATADDRAAATEEGAIERNDMTVDDEAALDEVTLPPTAPIASPGTLPPDGL